MRESPLHTHVTQILLQQQSQHNALSVENVTLHEQHVNALFETHHHNMHQTNVQNNMMQQQVVQNIMSADPAVLAAAFEAVEQTRTQATEVVHAAQHAAHAHNAQVAESAAVQVQHIQQAALAHVGSIEQQARSILEANQQALFQAAQQAEQAREYAAQMELRARQLEAQLQVEREQHAQRVESLQRSQPASPVHLQPATDHNGTAQFQTPARHQTAQAASGVSQAAIAPNTLGQGGPLQIPVAKSHWVPPAVPMFPISLGPIAPPPPPVQSPQDFTPVFQPNARVPQQVPMSTLPFVPVNASAMDPFQGSALMSQLLMTIQELQHQVSMMQGQSPAAAQGASSPNRRTEHFHIATPQGSQVGSDPPQSPASSSSVHTISSRGSYGRGPPSSNPGSSSNGPGPSGPNGPGGGGGGHGSGPRPPLGAQIVVEHMI